MAAVLKKTLFLTVLLPLMVSADLFPSLDLDFSGLSSLSKMGEQLDRLVETEKKLDKLPIVLGEANRSEENDTDEVPLRPYLNKGTKGLETKYPWLYEKMEDLLMNEENLKAYVADSAYFQYLDDLNGDGIAEIFLYNSYRCGSGGCNFKVYQIDVEHQRLKELFNAYDNYERSDANILSTQHHGWKDIKLKKCYGALGCKELTAEYHQGEGYHVQYDRQNKR